MLINGYPSIGPVEEDNTLLRLILAQLEGGSSGLAPGRNYSFPSAYSVADLKALPTTNLPLSIIVSVIGATTPGSLNFYQLQAGSLPDNSPYYFAPTDNPNNHWMLLA